MQRTTKFSRILLAVLVAGSAGLTVLPSPKALAQSSSGGDSSNGLASLKTIAIPKPTNLVQYVKDEVVAVKLGKALFWDMQAGGDGKSSCASCHNAAGVDHRIRNTLNPHGSADYLVNAVVTASMFPVKTSLVVGSAGVRQTTFTGLADPLQANSGFPADMGIPVPDAVFKLGGANSRQVTERQAPSVINSVYYFRSNWDGSAREAFNGVNKAGTTPDAGNPKLVQVGLNGLLSLVSVGLNNSSLASQAVGPVNSPVEMSFKGRTFAQLGKKLLHPAVVPLGSQMVATDDSSLGQMSNGLNQGLNTRYADMVSQAFQPRWWNSSQCVDADKLPVADSAGCPNSFKVMEANFSLFWGVAIQLYQASLIADDTPFDRNALNTQQRRGLEVYTGQARCVQCHSGPELSKASVRNVLGSVPLEPATGFFNISLRPVAEDGGIKDVDIAHRALFKTPHLRNVELTGPYFHNGEAATLRQVVDFYDKGGEKDFRSKFTDSQIRPLGLSEQQKNDLVAFLIGLTDERVRNESKPFDHPSLLIHNGANPGGTDSTTNLQAVGAGGRSALGLAPVQRFLGLDPFQP